MMEHFTWTPERLMELVKRNFGRLCRAEQIYPWEDAYNVACEIGKNAVPKFTIDEGNRFAYEQIARWLVSDTSFQSNELDSEGTKRGILVKGIYLQGSTGSGKTLCLDIFNVVAKAMLLVVFSPAFPKEKAITDDLTQRMGDLHWKSVKAEDICQEYERTGDIDEYKKTPVLCIQDLGSEPTESLYMGSRRNVLRVIIEARGDRSDLLTLFTSNIPLSKLSTYYGDRAQSRLVSMCNVITLCGKDRRTEK